jgi:hypothetical protein
METSKTEVVTYEQSTTPNPTFVLAGFLFTLIALMLLLMVGVRIFEEGRSPSERAIDVAWAVAIVAALTALAVSFANASRGARLTFLADRLIHHRWTTEEIPYDAIRDARTKGDPAADNGRLVITLDGGREIVLRRRGWPIVEIAQLLSRIRGRAFATELVDDVRSGGEVRIVEPLPWHRVWNGGWGVARAMVALRIIAGAITIGLGAIGVEPNAAHGVGGLVAWSVVALSIAGKLRRSGLIVTETGVRDFRARREDEIPWSQVQRASVDPSGSIVLGLDEEGPEILVSLSASHALALPALVGELSIRRRAGTASRATRA